MYTTIRTGSLVHVQLVLSVELYYILLITVFLVH